MEKGRERGEVRPNVLVIACAVHESGVCPVDLRARLRTCWRETKMVGVLPARS